MEAEGSEMWVLEAMDFLWFDQIIFSPKAAPESPNFSFKNSFSKISSHEIPSPASLTTCNSQVDSSSEESDDHHHVHNKIQRLRLNRHVPRKTRYNSSSPKSAKKNSIKLEKTMSLGDLELEEVKGFMDLGFIFKKENLSRKMMRLVPGLKRLINAKHEFNDDQEIMRPYLSEAWVVKRQNYPSMKVRIEGDCFEMKKNLKCWARNVALAIHEEL